MSLLLYLPSNTIDRIFEEGSEYIFDEAIFEGMEGNDNDLPSDTQEIEWLFQGRFYILEFFIECNPEGLEYSSRRFFIETRRFDKVQELECCIDGSN